MSVVVPDKGVRRSILAVDEKSLVRGILRQGRVAVQATPRATPSRHEAIDRIR